MCLEEPPTTSLLARATSHPSLAAKEKKSDSSQKRIQSSFEDCSYKSSKDKPIQYQVKIIPRFLGFILCLCLLLHGPASWLSSSEFQNCVWKKIEIAAKPAQNLALQPTELQQTKVNFPYDVASGSSVYCNGDPVNGLDPDGRCVEGMVTGQSYNVPSYAGALMGRMNPFFSTTQQVFSTGEAYNANYETFGESHWNAINTTFNPAYAAIKGGYEATTGFGMSPNNLGQDLSVGQRIGSGVESVVGALSMVGIAEGASLVNSAVSSASVAAELTPFETMLAKVDELDFSTPRNGAVFYSGPGQGMRAASFAERTGGMTIDMTSGGQWLRENLGVFSRAEQDLIWQKASTPFAEGASGRINAFINGANPERAFRTIEEPILNVNQNVWKSTYHY